MSVFFTLAWLLVVSAPDIIEGLVELPDSITNTTGANHYLRASHLGPAFNPLKPNFGEGWQLDDKKFIDKIRHQVDSIAFGVWAFRSLLDPIFSSIEANSLSLRERFPYRIMSSDPDVIFFCRTDVQSCLTHLTERYAKYNLMASSNIGIRRLPKRKGYCDNTEQDLNICVPNDVFWERDYANVRKALTKGNPIQVVRHYKLLLTSMQFMCWYSMYELDFLRKNVKCHTSRYNEQEFYGMVEENIDTQQKSKTSFMIPNCFYFSFCPNPCQQFSHYVPKMKNPCIKHVGLKTHQCKLDYKNNKHFHHLIERDMNVTCECETGFLFDLELRICIKEYYHKLTKNFCDARTQQALYFPFGNICQCKLGYVWDDDEGKCIFNHMLVESKSENTLYNWFKNVFEKVHATLNKLTENPEMMIERMLEEQEKN